MGFWNEKQSPKVKSLCKNLAQRKQEIEQLIIEEREFIHEYKSQITKIKVQLKKLLKRKNDIYPKKTIFPQKTKIKKENPIVMGINQRGDLKKINNLISSMQTSLQEYRVLVENSQKYVKSLAL
jgi:hypothetical protein